MIQPRSKPALGVVFFELNEAERHFLEKFVAQGKLPNFARAIEGGSLQRTRVPEWNAGEDKAWRTISPWIIWPSVYTGLLPREHGIVGFGQDTASLRGRFVWDVLDQHGIETGILGSLMSFPPRTNGANRYYVPESLADDPSCFPAEARALQEFCVFSARNYSESFSLKAATAVRLLLRTRQSGVTPGTIWKTLRQVPYELVAGPSAVPERAMLHSYLTWDAFAALYPRFRPAYSSVHMNHVAYMQHRYWRAAEPEHFDVQLSSTDKRFFRDANGRRRYEDKFAGLIEGAFRYSDDVLGRILDMVDDRTVVLVGTALGQRPFDPAHEIHNPVVRLVHERELFDAIGLVDYEVLHQMNPDLTINFRAQAAAIAAEARIAALHVKGAEGLFTVQRRGTQVFCELNMPQRENAGEVFAIQNALVPSFRAAFARHIREHPTNDQSTAHHKDSGWLLAYCKGARVRAEGTVIAVTDIAPTILSLYGLPRQPWHQPDSRVAFTVEA